MHDQMNRISCTYDDDDDDGKIILSVAFREQFGCLREGGSGWILFHPHEPVFTCKALIRIFPVVDIFWPKRLCNILLKKNLPPPTSP